MNEEGYIKFNCRLIHGRTLTADKITEINRWRSRLYGHGLIGAYGDGTGFGNISSRLDGRIFIITGSATGGLARLDEGHYVVVNDYDLAVNSLVCTGLIQASSESLSHAAVYEASPQTMAVIHVHSPALWENLIHSVPTTGENITYGTPEMASEIKRLFNDTDVAERKIIVMGGHREGIIAFGGSLDEAGEGLLKHFMALSPG